ncbi:MAG: GNAT family N-acetyltransferase [Proteobacteria bacterium]|nr:GNAT family N-acetyltransferase [Pseudomonadota bacterium]
MNVIADNRAQRVATPAQEPMRGRVYDSFAVLPPFYDALFDQAASSSFCLTRPWFESLAANILGPDERLCLIGVETDALDPAPLALLVGRHRDRDQAVGGARIFSSLSNYYSMVFEPLLAESADPAQILRLLVKTIGSQRPKYDVLRFQPLDRASPMFSALQRALRQAGLATQSFFHLGNWHQCTAGMTSADYLAARPAALRNTIRRKGETLSKCGGYFEIITEGREIERGLGDYERVYDRSWKEPEPYPEVIRNLVRSCVADGALRLGLLYLAGTPIAAQIWIVWSGKATLYKLAHDRCFERLSPGSVLTMRMIERVIDVDRVAEVDLGVGDDPYKSQWASQRREHWGIISFNPRTFRGIEGIILHCIGTKLKKMIQRVYAANP